MNKEKFADLIKEGLEEGLQEVTFSDDDKREVIAQIEGSTSEGFTSGEGLSLIDKIREILNYEVEIPVSLGAVFSFAVLVFLAYDLGTYLPGAEEATVYHLEWVEMEYGGILK